MKPTNARNIYRQNAAETASKPTLVIMLLDRAVADILAAIAAIESRRVADAHQFFIHAQDIVAELRHALDADALDAGSELVRIYDFIEDSLATANINKDPVLAAEVLELTRTLALTFRQLQSQAA